MSKVRFDHVSGLTESEPVKCGGETIVRASKWISGTTPQQPLTQVARRVLRERLDVVWYYAPLAATNSKKNTEYVHQLRVATRRARAALHLFGEMLPKRQARWMKKMLRHLRRAAGDARDLDVMGTQLKKVASQKHASRLSVVIKQTAARRREAQKPLLASYKRARQKQFKKRSRKLTESVRWAGDRPEPRFDETARTMLAPLVDEFFAAAGDDLSDVEALHQMRIAGKQVRYAMELLAGAFDESFRRDLYVTFEEVQERLGTINDHVTAIAALKRWSKRADDGNVREEMLELIANQEQQLDDDQRGFHQWWTAERAAQLEHSFASVLQVPRSDVADGEAAPQETPTGVPG